MTSHKTVSFHYVSRLENGNERRLTSIPWSTILQQWSKLRPSNAERQIDDLVYSPILDRELPALGIHKPISTDFLTKIDRSGSDINDVAGGDDAGGDPLAQSSVVAFLPDYGAVAFARGSNTSPYVNKLNEFLTRADPPSAGHHWKTQPIMTRDTIDRLQRADGVHALKARFSSSADLFTPDSGGITQFADQIAARINGDVEIYLEVRLANNTKTRRGPQQAFKRLVEGDWKRLRHSTKAQITPIEGGLVSMDDINVVEERMAFTEDVEGGTVGERKFTELVDATVAIAQKRTQEVYSTF